LLPDRTAGAAGANSGETDAHGNEDNEMSMASTARTNLGRRLRLAVAGAAVATVLTTATASTTPRSQFPAFLLDRGSYTSFEAPDPDVRLNPLGINNRGVTTNPDSLSGRMYTPTDRRGRITVFDIPGAKGTEAARINDRGQVVGLYENPSGGRGSV
jgi:hypothetical protein